jgi:hypothetical protein
MRKPKRRKPNPAYKLLRELGMRPAVARHFVVGLRKRGFVVVEESKIVTAAQINRQIEIIIKLMKMGKTL